jgi:hypothetical protein
MSADFRAALADFVRGLFPRYAYLGLFPARVVAQNADLTLELVPDDSSLPRGLSNVKVQHGLGPGVQVKVAPGARVLLGFRGGKPDEPFACLWESGALQELVVSAAVRVTVDAPLVLLADGAQGVARIGDTVVAGPYSGTITGGSLKVKA